MIFGKTTKQVEKTEIKLIAGSILGISYFFIWPYVYYYAHLLAWSETVIQISFAALVAVSLLFARALVEVKFYEVMQVISVGLFLVFWMITASYDTPIRDKIADFSGYFGEPLKSNFDNTGLLRKQINSPNKAYSALIPEFWKEYKHEGTLLPFYRPTNTTSAFIELRPGCNIKQKVNISKTIEGMSTIHQKNETSDHKCFLWNNHGYACRVSISDKAGIRRVRWLGANKQTNRLLQLDFVMQNGSQQDLMLTNSIFKSIKFN